AEAWRLQREAAVVVVGGRPEHRAGGHHALGHLPDLGRVAAALTAALGGGAKIPRIHEADEVVALLVEPRERALRIGGPRPEPGMPRLDVRRALRALVVRRPRRRALG